MTSAFKIATFNLYHFAEPEIWWYRRAPDATPAMRFTPEEWAAKTAWIGATLAEMAADVVGFQEVVSVEALRRLTAAAGYPHFATVAEPRIVEEAGEAVYVRPVQAIASRWPMRAARATPRPGYADALGRALGFSGETAWDYRRAPVKAWVATPAFGEVLVYCAHLKSPGVSVGDAPLQEAGDAPAERAALEALSRAHVFAAAQRAMEASALYHDAAEEVDRGGTDRLVAIVGDLNDAPDAPALRALTADRPEERDGGAIAPGASRSARFRLVDAYRLAPKEPTTDRRPPTHRAAAFGQAIDFVLLSAAAHPWTAAPRVEVAAHQVWDAHFYAGDPRRTSDHAPVLTTLAPRRA